MKKTIIAYKSILENTVLGTVFIAGPLEAQTQCEGENRDHIEWVGDLDVPVTDVAVVLRELYEEIKHGDQEHQDWLRNKIEEFIDFKGY